MKVVIFTQVYENYAWREDGSIGTGPEAYWKPKGGDAYFIRNIKSAEEATAAVMAVRGDIEHASDYYTETIVDWNLVADDYLTEYEKSQLEFDGRIEYPAKELTWA